MVGNGTSSPIITNEFVGPIKEKKKRQNTPTQTTQHFFSTHPIPDPLILSIDLRENEELF